MEKSGRAKPEEKRDRSSEPTKCLLKEPVYSRVAIKRKGELKCRSLYQKGKVDKSDRRSIILSLNFSHFSGSG